MTVVNVIEPSAIIGRHYHHRALGRRIAFSRDVLPVTASRWEFVACYGACSGITETGRESGA